MHADLGACISARCLLSSMVVMFCCGIPTYRVANVLKTCHIRVASLQRSECPHNADRRDPRCEVAIKVVCALVRAVSSPRAPCLGTNFEHAQRRSLRFAQRAR